MNRRKFLKSVAAVPLAAVGGSFLFEEKTNIGYNSFFSDEWRKGQDTWLREFDRGVVLIRQENGETYSNIVNWSEYYKEI